MPQLSKGANAPITDEVVALTVVGAAPGAVDLRDEAGLARQQVAALRRFCIHDRAEGGGGGAGSWTARLGVRLLRETRRSR